MVFLTVLVAALALVVAAFAALVRAALSFWVPILDDDDDIG